MTSFKAFIAVVLGAALLVGPACAADTRTCVIVIINKNEDRVRLLIETARSEAEKERGLMHRKNLEKNSGMLFIFAQEQYLNFWMKNTHIPLSIAYIGENGIIRDMQDMRPLDTSVTYPSRYPALYALEVNRGWFAENGIVPGCRVELDGCIGK
ncbi:MAG TPA: DUF192 domain-containing protein [Spirochaetota bacterium]|nr:DUF192 domain-containing protein [Spirochaetota bacterium]